MKRLALVGLAGLLGLSLASCATSEERRRARAEKRAAVAHCSWQSIPVEERLPRVRQALQPFIGRTEQETFTVLNDCKLRGDPGRVAKYTCRFRYEAGCPRPASKVTVVFTDGLLTNWILDR